MLRRGVSRSEAMSVCAGCCWRRTFPQWHQATLQGPPCKGSPAGPRLPSCPPCLAGRLEHLPSATLQLLRSRFCMTQCAVITGCLAFQMTDFPVQLFLLWNK